jgi:hypothetical protein
VRVLRDEGPALSRPLVDTLATSNYPDMKELRPRGTSIRILFAFDPRRVAILLPGGNRAGQWKQWYVENIPRADRLYAGRLRSIEEEQAAERQGERGGQEKIKGKKKGKKR